MGGSGSGRYGAYSAAATCESYQSIDLAWLRRRNFLEVGRRSTITWSRRGQRTGSISITPRQEGLRVDYQNKDGGGEPLRVSELIPFIYTATRFSGRRRWFQCLHCGQRCRVIYGGRYFRCRRCHGLRYQSQSEPDYDRALERANRIRKQLGDSMFSAFEDDDLPPKPSRMRWTTYRKLQVQYAALQRRWKAGAAARFGLRF